MTTLTFKKHKIPAANMGQINCLPDIHNNAYIRSPITMTDKVSADERKTIGQGMISTLLPYQIQDQYDRSRDIREFDAAVLENEYMIATFIPELGGRLWSLYDKKEKRELLYDNDVFQPANLALRNAWFSGGVEWNAGIKGHNPYTCSPIHAKKQYNKDGDPVLKMYEFERIRGTTYAISATLKKDVLLVHIDLENTSDKDSFMYWWSNIAVDETEKTRVIVPTDKTFICAYSDGAYLLDCGDIPNNEGVDVTYPTTAKRSRDFFYKIPENERKWIAAVDGEGKGLIHFSDNTLKGRKMFLWGQQSGGKHWNQWLSDRGDAYIEIQAGVLKTQYEHFVLSKNSSLSWTEGYSLVSGNPQILHGDDYDAAAKEIAQKASDKFEFVYGNSFEIEKEDPIALFGSGWGALENMVRDVKISNTLSFPEESFTSEQADWLSVLREGKMPEHNPDDVIPSYILGDFWIEKLESLENKDWYVYNHLGIMYYAKGDYEKSAKYFEKSTELTPNAWALRNLAQIKKNIENDAETAADMMMKAIELKSDYQPLLANCADALIFTNRYEEWIKVYHTLSDELKQNGRLLMLLCLCYVKTNQLDKAKEIITPSLQVYDMREGEYALSGIWTELHTKILAKERGIDEKSITPEETLKAYPLPFELDFRMH